MTETQQSFPGFEIRYTKGADKFFLDHEDIRCRYEECLRRLLEDDHPESVDRKKVLGKRGDYYRIRISDYRVIYTVINGDIIVIATLLAGPRGDIYKKTVGLP